MKDERFLYPLSIFDYQNGKISVAFRRRNHMIPCTTRRMKTDRKKVRRIVGVDVARGKDWTVVQIDGYGAAGLAEVYEYARRLEFIRRWIAHGCWL